MTSLRLGQLVLCSVALGVAATACSAVPPPQIPRLQPLTPHATGTVIDPPATGTGNADLGSLDTEDHLSIDVTCSGSGLAIVTLLPSPVALSAVCSPLGSTGGTISSATFSHVPVATTHLRVTANSATAWSVAVYR